MSRHPIPVEFAVPTGTTNAYLIGHDEALLVDPPARHEALDSAVSEANVAHLAVTHTHPDHVGGVAHYADATGATVWARRGRVDAFEAATGIVPDRTFAEGTHIETDAGPVETLETPGHARDHVAFEMERNGEHVVLCGDLAVATGSVTVSAPDGEMRAYLSSLRRLRARAPDRLCPGHGPTVDDSRATLDRLLRHRLTRERKVRAAVENGARTLDGVVDGAYDKDLTGVRAMATATVRAHLEKLAVEGSVVWDEERGRVTPGSDGV